MVAQAANHIVDVALSGWDLTAGGLWNFVSSTRPWPSGVRIM